MEQFQEIGYTKKTHGVKGGIRIVIHDLYLDSFFQAQAIFIDQKGTFLPFFIEEVQETNDLIVKFEDINSKEEAQLLAGCQVYLRKEELDLVEALPENLEETESFVFLRGFILEDVKLGKLGPIIAVEEYPQQQMGIVEYQGKEVMVPLHSALIKEIFREEKKVVIELPGGLLEVN